MTTENDEGGRTGTELMADGMAGAGDNGKEGTAHESTPSLRAVFIGGLSQGHMATMVV
jgi:hypothetical protein